MVVPTRRFSQAPERSAHGRRRRRELDDWVDGLGTLLPPGQTPVGRVGRVLSPVSTRPV